ncbi:MAG: acetyl-CoA C-acyltransferase [Propionibacteriales bacterium]|nr:acetyl-CoA C-acyltransferase [Propionibacteriales bacterium]
MIELRSAFIIDAVRTPFGRNRGALSHIRTDDLAALPIAELVKRHSELDPEVIDDVYYGNANGAGEDNRNVARMSALLAGLPATIPGATVNRLCASGNEAVIQAARAVAVGEASLCVAGGVEGMSRAPYVLAKPDEGLPRSMKLEQTQLGWRMVNPKFPDRWTASLGACAERVAAELGIGRAEQDEWAARSHQRVHAAYEAGVHDGFVMDVEGVRRDESLRPDTTTETLAGLKPAFTPDGSVTAGNSSPVNDGALAMFIGDRRAVDESGQPPLGRIVASATTAVEPDRFTIAPVSAIQKVLRRCDLSFADVALWEINEAFAAMVLSMLHGLPDIDRERVNVHGGAIAIGHPLGASAPRVTVDLCRELRRRGGGIGVAAACIGVGQGQAVVVQVD